MDKFDRLMTTFSGGSLDRWAYALWKHFPGDDRTPQGFADAHVRFQKTYDSDVLKLTPHGSFCTVDWGCGIGPVHPVNGSTTVVDSPIKDASDFEKLEEVDPMNGEFGLQLEGVRRVVKSLGGQVPLMMTIFSPFMVGSLLDSNILYHVKEDPFQIENGLKVITKVITEFGRTVLDVGADGLFVASLHSVEGKLSGEQFSNFEVNFTLKLLNELRAKADFIVFHIHGNKPLFKYIANNYPIDAINWHSQLTTPTIGEALQIFNKGLFGGIDETEIARKGRTHAIKKKLQEVMQISNSRLLLAPGCVIPIDTPVENLRRIVKAIRNSPPPILQ
ncbi:MAG: uroporphyrinogen decarboxylase family protein [Promethearchaeota archaeon]